MAAKLSTKANSGMKSMTSTQPQGKKLTPLQLETLAAIGRGEVFYVRFGYRAWRIRGASSGSVGVLVSRLKLAMWLHSAGDRQPCALTPAGRLALEEGR